MEQTMNMMGGIGSMAPAGSMGSQEETAASNAFRNTDRGSLVRDLNEATEGVAPGAIQSIVAELRTMGFDAEDVSNWIEILDETLADPQAYVTNRQDLIQQGMEPEFLPEDFDYGYLVALRMAFETLRGEVGGMPAMGGMGMMPVQGFAQGGIAELKPIAQALSRMGRNGDTMLAHITPQEAMMLRRMGGSGTINPYTGLPEYFKKFFKSVGKAIGGAAKSVGKAVKKFAQSDIGRMVLTIGLTMLAGPAAYAILGATAPAWAVTALAAGMAGTGTALLGGSNLKDSLKAGLSSAVVAGVGSAAYSGISGAGVNTPYTGPKSYGELFETTQPAAPIEDATLRADSSLSSGSTSAPVTTSDVGTGTFTPADVSAGTAPPPSIQSVTAPPPGPQYSFESPGFIQGDSFAQSGFTQDQLLASEMGNYTPPLRYTPPPPTSAVTQATQGAASFDPRLALGDVGSGSPVVTGSTIRLPPSSFSPSLADYASSGDAAALGGGTGMDLPGPSVYDRATGALKSGYQGAKNVYSDYIDPSRGMPTTAQINAKQLEIMATGSSADAARAEAIKTLTPSMISQYAPAAGVALGAAYLGGAFTPEAPPEPNLIKGPTGIDLYQANPEQYRPNIVAGQTPITYQDPNQALYRQQQYNPYDPLFFQPRSQYTPQQPVVRRAEGGITETSKFKRKMGPINGPGTGTSDDIPAMLSDGEFVFTARAVRGMGNGSRRKGAKEMYRLMKMLEKKVGGKP